MTDSLAWVGSYAEQLVREAPPEWSLRPTEPAHPEPSAPLGVLLFWLDCLSFLANSSPLPTPLLQQANPPPPASADEPGPAGRAGSPSGREAGSSASHSESTDDFLAYLDQVYLGPGTAHLWPSPLAVGPLVWASGDALGGEGTDPLAPRTVISLWAAKAQDWFSSPQNQASSPSTTPEQLSSVAECSHLLAPPLGPSLLATIASTLASSRQRQSGRTPPTLTFRWTLSTILSHYFPARFSQQMDDGVITYARDPASDAGLQSYHDRIHHLRFWTGDDDEPTTPIDLEADRAEGIRAATLSIAKRDDKMRWLLGDNFQNRSGGDSAFRSSDRPATIVGSGASPTSALRSEPQPRRLSLSSLESALPEPSHSRSISGSSSRSPLLPPDSPTSPSGAGLSHRRGISVPALGGSHDLPALSPSVPFANFDVVAPVSPADRRIGTPVPPLSPTNARPSQGGAGSAIVVPPHRNSLSQDEKRDLVKRSKKLEQMFGVPLEEAAAGRVLVGGQPLDGHDPTKLGALQITPTRPSKGRRRSASFPPPSPTSASFEDAQFFLNASPTSQGPRRLSPPNLGSSGMVRSVSSPNSTSPITDDVFLPDTPTLPNAIQFSALGGTSALQKEERRRKLAKLQRLLGERVPAELALNQAPGRWTSSGAQGMGRSGSRLGGMLKGKLGFGQAHRDEHLKRDEGFVVVDQDALAAAEQQTSQSSTPSAPIKGLARARKLEHLFGDLPPPNLYRGHAHHLSASEPLHRVSSTSSAARSIHSFRTSIASLQYLAEQDPDTLDRITEEYATSVRTPATITLEEPSPTLSQGTNGDDEDDDRADEGDAARAMAKNVERRESAQSAGSSASHRRTVKKAQKLASFFGTTRGEVWGLLLDDLEAAITEEDGLDDEERAEVLGGVHRLRQTGI